eukprot:5499226-Prymnesium_polylepis.1
MRRELDSCDCSRRSGSRTALACILNYFARRTLASRSARIASCSTRARRNPAACSRFLLLFALSQGCEAHNSGCSCTESCDYATDGECDDGGSGAEYAECALGTDCSDCGSRCPSPPSATPS